MKQIHFKGSIRNLQNQLINLEGVAIDFFDSSKNKWLPLIKEITVAKGEIDIPYSISKRKATDKKIIEVIEKGLFPSFRLSWNKTSKINKVFRVGGAVEINSDTETTVHFGELYLVEISGKQKSTSGIGFQQVAIPKIAEYNAFFKELITGFNSESTLETKNLDVNPSLSREALNIKLVDDIGDGNGGGNNATINALNQVIANLRRQLNTKDSEIGNLKRTNTTLSNQNTALVKERNNLVAQGTHLRNENTRLLNENQTLNGRLSSLQSQVSSLNSTISAKNAHITKLDTEIKNLKAQITNLDAKIKQLKTDINRLETENHDLKTSNNTLTTQNQKLNNNITQKKAELKLELEKNENLEKKVKGLEDEKKTLKADLSEEQQKAAALSQEKNTLIAEKGVLESKLAIKKQEIVVLNTEKNELKLEIEQLNISHPGESKAFKINDIYRQLVEDVNSASLELKNVGNYQLGNVTIDLKTHIQNDDKGLKVQTLDKDSAKSINEGAVSNVKINIESTKETQKVERVSVPDFRGLTEKAAKKKALQFNVKLTPIYQYNQTERIGSAFMQLPKPSERVLPLTKVKVFFAKN